MLNRFLRGFIAQIRSPPIWLLSGDRYDKIDLFTELPASEIDKFRGELNFAIIKISPANGTRIL